MKNGGRIPWNVSASLRNTQDLLSDGKTPYERRFGAPYKGPIIPFGSLVECHLSLRNTSQESISLEKVLLGLFFGYAVYEGNLEK